MSRLFPPRRRATLWVALLMTLACPAAAAKTDFTVQPPPSWVQTVAAPADANKREPEDGLRCMLDDRQVRVTSNGSQNYNHFVQQATTSAAVEQLSQLRLDFEPSYQSLVIHHIHVIRAGQTINALRPSEIKVIQREDELDKQLFNGTLSAVVVLNDVRPGDVIDYAYKDSKHEFPAQYFGSELSKPDDQRRTSPLGVTFPYHVEQLTEIRLPYLHRVTTGAKTNEDDAMRFTSSVEADGSVVRLRYTLVTKQDTVPVAKVEKHLATLDKATDVANFELTQGSPVAPRSFVRGSSTTTGVSWSSTSSASAVARPGTSTSTLRPRRPRDRRRLSGAALWL